MSHLVLMLLTDDLLVTINLKPVIANKLLQLVVLLTILALHRTLIGNLTPKLTLKLLLHLSLFTGHQFHLLLHFIAGCVRQIELCTALRQLLANYMILLVHLL